MPRFSHRARVSGSSLVTTLLVIVILSIIVTAFLQSMTIERQTARSYMNRYRATLAAEAAAAQCQNLMVKLFETYPDSCTAWAKLPNTSGTFFYYRTLTGTDTAALPKDTATGMIDIKALPLISGATPQLAKDFDEAKSFPDGFTKTNSTDLNRKNWIGTPADATDPTPLPQVLKAQWVDMLEDPTKPRDDSFNSSTGRPKNGAIARYAFWIEDDTFRVNINVAGATPRESDTKGSRPDEIDLKGVTEAAQAGDISAKIVEVRDTLPNQKFLSSSQVNYADPGGDPYEKLKYYITDTSKALNFSRGGVKRLDLNQVVMDTNAANDIHTQIARIIAAIGNDRAMPDINSKKSKSDFGQRFAYTGSSTSGALLGPMNDKYKIKPLALNYPDIYLQKLAANIRDYIDTDSQPTIVDNDPDYSVREAAMADSESMIGYTPTGIGGSASDTVAVGKEAVPALQEHFLRVKLNSMNPPKYAKGTAESSKYDMEESHYFEFVNPTNKDIKVSNLGTSPFLLIANQFGYDTAGGTNIPAGRVIQIALGDFVDGSGQPLTVFPAGKATVLTTDPDPLAALAPGADVNTFYRPKDPAAIESKRHFTGTTLDHTGSPTMFRLLPKVGNTAGRGGSSSTDYDTHVLLGNSKGVLESFTALAMAEALSIKYDDNQTTPPDAKTQFFRGGSLKGNLSTGTPFNVSIASGDPRSLNEQLFITRYNSSISNITRFLKLTLAEASLGTFANTSFLDAKLWPDYGAQTESPSAGRMNLTAGYSRVADTKLNSIGQLGDIYDPIREYSDPDYSRGGGRSLRIGQSELWKSGSDAASFGMWDGKQDSLSRNRVAWRLADVFSTNHEMVNPGVININGASRDNGAAIKAALYQLKFGDATGDDESLSGKSADLGALVDAILERFPSNKSNDPKLDNPFWERGELSEVQDTDGSPIFNTGKKLVGVDMKAVSDRGREELVRRIMELITTKGNVYRAYCVGEALATNRNGQTRVLSHQQLKVTFEILPVFDQDLPADDAFDATKEYDEGSTTRRFRKPDSYQVKIVSVDTQ